MEGTCSYEMEEREAVCGRGKGYREHPGFINSPNLKKMRPRVWWPGVGAWVFPPLTHYRHLPCPFSWLRSCAPTSSWAWYIQ